MIKTGYSVDEVIRDWSKDQRECIQSLRKQYGEPTEVTNFQVEWHNNGPWRRTIVYRQTMVHDFPVHHEDFIGQTIYYHVPLGRIEDVVDFDGSIIVDRTSGEVTARCNSEAANTLALNLMNDIVNGNISVDDARKEFALTLAKYMVGGKDPRLEKLQFRAPEKDTNDPDKSNLTQAMLDEAKKRIGEFVKR